MVNILYRSTDNAKWGPGKDSRLTIAEGDENLWELDKAVTNLQNNPPSAVEISNILVLGDQMQIEMSDGSHFGPFTLPTAAFRYRNDGYNVGNTYVKLDLLPIAQQGLFMVAITHEATGPFNPNALDPDSGDPLFQLLYGEETYIYDFSFSYPGKPGQGVTIGDDIAEHMFLRDVYFPANFTDSLAKLSAAPTSDLVYDIQKDGVTFGSLTFAASSLVGVFDLPDVLQFGNGETLGLKKLTDTDPTARGLRIGFSGRRGIAPTT